MEPLALQMRPKSLDEVLGQKHLVGENKILTNLKNNNRIFSMILYGAPGIGKTSIAKALVSDLKLKYRFLNATVNNKKDFDVVIEEAKMYKGLVLIMDEIHRLNKDKQDLLLPYLENGLITLIGMTTSNPFHSINPAIRSRCQIFELKSLTDDDIIEGLDKSLKLLDGIIVDKKTIKYIANMASGDLRFAYNLLEVAYYSTNDKVVNIDIVKKINHKPNVFHDKNGDGYYEAISALQKSIRGSNVDAAIHYLARLIDAGDLDIIYRRLSVIAYEDIGLANPMMGVKVDAAINACVRLGLPEARIILANIVIELSLSPKSNSAYLAIDKALNDVRSKDIGRVPTHLNNHSDDYKYPHDYPNHIVKQQYLPNKLKGSIYYEPQNNKNEQNFKKINDKIKEIID